MGSYLQAPVNGKVGVEVLCHQLVTALVQKRRDLLQQLSVVKRDHVGRQMDARRLGIAALQEAGRILRTREVLDYGYQRFSYWL